MGTMGRARRPSTIAKLMGKRAASSAPCCGRGRSTRRSRSVSDSRGEILPGFDAGKFAPVIDTRFLDEMADVHRMMEANANFGKIAIDVQS